MEVLLQNIPIQYFTFMILIFAFGMTFWMIPIMIGIIETKNIMDDPNSRSSHVIKTPTLGGFVFFVVLMMSVFLLKDYDTTAIGFHIIPGMTILFFVGLKDDLMVLDPKKKILAQLAAITFILMEPGLLPTNFHGFLGLAEIPLWLSTISAYFIVLCVINAYNLIDGIDGLAAMVGIVIFIFFSYVFYTLHMYYFSLLAVVCIGFLIGFLRYNLSKTNKIFMGDTGSMIVGFLIGFMCLRFLSLDELALSQINLAPRHLFLFTLAILFVMVIDTVRVVIIRLLHKKGPFSPDRNHVHHILIDQGISHRRASVFISGVNILMISLFVAFNEALSAAQLLGIFLLLTFSIVLLLFHLNKNFAALRQKIQIKEFFFNKENMRRLKKIKLTALLIGFIKLFT